MDLCKVHSCTVLLLFLILLVLPLGSLASVGAHIPCEPFAYGSCRDTQSALKFKLGSIGAILVAGVIGVCLPILGTFFRAIHPDGDGFFALKAFAAGIILGVGCIHILPNAYQHLGSSCLSGVWREFNFTGFILVMAMVATLMIDTIATSYYKRTECSAKAKPVGDEDSEHGEHGSSNVHGNGSSGHGHGHAHGSGDAALPVDVEASQLNRRRVISRVLELGVLVHSLIIGVSLGTSKSPCLIRPLMVALSFHQFFEGVGLSGCILQAQFKGRTTAIMAILFSLTTPMGVALGTGISSLYDENSPTALAIEGVLDSAAAGILVYMALVDILAVDMMHPRMQSSAKLQITAHFFLLLGVTIMTILAKWA